MVRVNGQTVGSIEKGYLLFLGVLQGDTEAQADWLADKILKLRLFESSTGKINDQTIGEVGGGMLVISQFTLAGDLSGGHRPDYTAAEERGRAEELYTYFVDILRKSGLRIETGQFGAAMDVALINEGPVTLLLDK